MRHIGYLAMAVLFVAGIAAARTPSTSAPQTAMNVLTDQEKAAGWRLLFDGQTTAGWRGFKRADMPAGWRAIDGALTRAGEAGDIVTIEQFGDFDLAFDWKVTAGGNSGVFFRVLEDVEAVWHSAPEYQILDNVAHRHGLTPETSAGADYALHAPSRDATRPVGSWNQGRILVRGAHVEHWLNREKIVEYELWTPDWITRVKASKFKEFPNFGRAAKGHIAIQDHGDAVGYRNIKIRTY